MHVTRPRVCRLVKNPAEEDTKDRRFFPIALGPEELRDAFFEWAQSLVNALWERLNWTNALNEAISLAYWLNAETTECRYRMMQRQRWEAESKPLVPLMDDSTMFLDTRG